MLFSPCLLEEEEKRWSNLIRVSPRKDIRNQSFDPKVEQSWAGNHKTLFVLLFFPHPSFTFPFLVVFS